MAKVINRNVSRARALGALRVVYMTTNMTEKDFLVFATMLDEKYPKKNNQITIPQKID